MTTQEQQMTETNTPAQGVKLDGLVKPLAWQDFEGQGAKASAFYQASYMIAFWRGRDEFEVSMSYPGYQAAYDGPRFHKTLEAAKAAAQADYTARILAALDTDAIAALVGALREIRSGWTAAADPDTGELVEVAMSEDEMISIARTALARLGVTE
jgi:hypothetical protein